MTNPGDIVRVRARRGGRASIYEANGWCQGFTDGLLDGNGVIPNTVADLNVLVGGTPSCPDVVLAKNPAGYRIALDLVGQQAITLTTPASNSRISSIVAYTDDLSLATNQSNVTGSPASCGLIIVNGAASANPVPPTETEIRAAITADGATGSQACYGVIASVTVASNATTITTTNIDIQRATLAGKIASHNVDWETMKAFVPDYANMSTDNLITGGGILTVPGNGWVSLNLNAYTFSQTEVIVKVNGKQIVDYITEIKGSNGATPNAVYGIIPVAKGDVIEISGNNPNWNFRRGYFIPGKWV